MAHHMRTVERPSLSWPSWGYGDSDTNPDNITHDIYNVSLRAVRYGGTADVYQGLWRRPAGAVHVALKVFRVVNPCDITVQRRLRREIYIWKQLVHPNVHQLCGIYENLGPLPALVSEWCESGDIKQYLVTRSADPDLEGIKLKLILNVAQGLEYLHGKEVVHGDIKGANVLISDDGTAKLGDFGFSDLLADYSQSLTQTSNIHGTYRWMAPELVFDEGARHSYSSDIWAFGCLVIEVSSGQVPYHTMRNYLQFITALARDEPPPVPPDMSDFLSTIVEDCCTFVTKERPTASYIVARIQPKAVSSRISFMITRGHPLEKAGEILLELIENSITAAATHQDSLYCDLSALGDAGLAAVSIRRLAIESAVASSSSNPYDVNIWQWCLDKIIGAGNMSLRSIQRLTAPDINIAMEEEGGIKTRYHPSALQPLATLLAAVNSSCAEGLLSDFGASLSNFALDSVACCAAWHPDNSRIAVGLEDGTLRILDVASGAALHRLAGHMNSVTQVTVSPDGRRLASCSYDRAIRLWDAETGHAIGSPLVGHTAAVWAVAFSPDAQRIVSGSVDKTIRIWCPETCTTVLGPLGGHTGTVCSVAYSPDGARTVSGALDTTVRVWDSHTGHLIMTLRGHTNFVRSVAYSPDGVRIVSGSSDRTVRVWDAITGEIVRDPLKGHSNSVMSVAFSPDSTRIVSGSCDRTIRFWGSATGTSVKISGLLNTVYSVAFSPDGRRLASASDDNTIRIWDVADEWAR